VSHILSQDDMDRITASVVLRAPHFKLTPAQVEERVNAIAQHVSHVRLNWAMYEAFMEGDMAFSIGDEGELIAHAADEVIRP
jgi:hypothetical protein